MKKAQKTINGYAAGHIFNIDGKKKKICHHCVNSKWMYEEFKEKNINAVKTGKIIEIHSDEAFCGCCGDYFYN